MRLSVIVITYNSAKHLRQCLASIEEHLKGVEYEVCVVDNASDDDSAALVGAAGGSVRLLSNTRNLGFARAINIGLENTSGHYVMWLNPDAAIEGGDIGELLRYMDRKDEVGVLGPQLLNADGTLQLSCRSFPSYSAAFFNRYSLLTKLFPSNRYSSSYLHSDWDHESLREVDWVSGACLLHRRSLLEDIGEVDEHYFMYIEDIDFCLRANRAGWKIHYHPALRVRHHIGGSSRQVPLSMIVELHKSIWRYYAKHFRRHPLKDAAAWTVVWGRCAGMLARTILRRAITGQTARGAVQINRRPTETRHTYRE